ncbi:UNKNOWN [Stylonychia lemnae]|uniref:Uncharacterized protein n=1 Tax=Stylonychia lemnae TaxID=5949 RepID=A0A078B3N6_STYLE|nr:UNKNOWN [Stylonychia lemnae]|eukprot:CDW89150.1 UNKNOWN [Stylonychia lemnae]
MDLDAYDVRVAMKSLLDYIQGDSGELEKYWSIVEKQNDDARRAARRLEKERRRLEMGSDYESSEGEHHDYYSDEYTDSEAEESQEEEPLESSRLQSVDYSNMNSMAEQSKQSTTNQPEPIPIQELPFNAVRFLGEKLREVINQRKLEAIMKEKAKKSEQQSMIDSKNASLAGIISRPPSGTKIQFYAIGKYDNVTLFQDKSSTFEKRNKRADEEIEIKPITMNSVDINNYNPKAYLNPFQYISKSSPNTLQRNEPLFIVSKCQGWITVDPDQNLSRNKPFERQPNYMNEHDNSKLAPQWMTSCSIARQTQKKNKKDLDFDSTTQKGLLYEGSRTFLVDRQQPQRSVLNLGHTRHNVPFKQMIQEIHASSQPARLVEWNGVTQSEVKMRPVTGKIGQIAQI